jgi:hypothetical protein
LFELLIGPNIFFCSNYIFAVDSTIELIIQDTPLVLPKRSVSREYDTILSETRSFCLFLFRLELSTLAEISQHFETFLAEALKGSIILAKIFFCIEFLLI